MLLLLATSMGTATPHHPQRTLPPPLCPTPPLRRANPAPPTLHPILFTHLFLPLTTPPLPQFSGKLLELANQHTASRVIQFCLKEGSPEAKAQISKEVRALTPDC